MSLQSSSRLPRNPLEQGTPSPAAEPTEFPRFPRRFGLFMLRKRVSVTDIHKAPSVSRLVTVTNQLGIHARPSAQFVKLAATFPCDVWIEKDEETINGKSIMGLLMLAAGPGSELRIICSGPGSDQALLALVRLVENKFGEH